MKESFEQQYENAMQIFKEMDMFNKDYKNSTKRCMSLELMEEEQK